jgi:predicted dehydrogenase/nucleoside-diphosphate-sugar epimerase
MEPSSNRKRFRAGIVGAGYVSSYHVRALRRLDFVEIAAVCDPDTARAAQLAKSFGIPAVCGTLDELLAVKPDVVHVLTPPHLHAAIAIQAMRAGCHVLVEKPMAESVEDCDRMIAAARETGRQLSVNHSARMDPVVLKAIELARSGACGDILAVHFLRNSDYPPYAGGPVPAPYRKAAYPFEDIGIHGLYLLEAFLGPVEDLEVRFRSTGQNPNLFLDEWHGLARCEKGMGHLYLSWNARPMQNELIVHGTRAILRVDCYLQTMTMERTLPAPKPLVRMFGTGMNALETMWRVPINAFRFVTGSLLPNPGIQVSVARFYEALAAGAPPPVTAEEGRRMVDWATRPAEEAENAKARAFATSPCAVAPKILVTGATGFLGGALFRRLRQRGERVRVLARRPMPALVADPDVEVVYGDLGDPDAVDRAVQGIEVVFHAGATMRGGKLDHDRGTLWGTRNVIASCLRHGVKRLVYVSSIIHLHHAAHTPGTAVDESYPLEPRAEQRGYYTQAKLEAERMVRDAIRDQQLPAVILRPGQIFGRGAEKSSPAGAIGLAGRWIVVGSGDLRLPLVYVEDVVDALLAAAEREEALGGTFQLVDPTPVTQRQYVGFCQRAFGGQIKALYTPRLFLWAAAVAADVVSRLTHINLPLSRYRLRSSRPLSPFDCSAAARKLGWTPRIGALQGLKDTFENRPAAQPDAAPARP